MAARELGCTVKVVNAVYLVEELGDAGEGDVAAEDVFAQGAEDRLAEA